MQAFQNERAKLRDLPPSMADRAMYARRTACEAPSLVEVDDDFLPWVYCEDDERWYSFDGNYSASSPDEKRQKHAEREARREFLEDEAIKKAAEDIRRNIFWSKVRKDVLMRDDYTCQLCDKRGDGKFHVHHIMKIVAGGSDHYDNLQTVCPTCHPKLDKKLYNPEWI